MESKMTLGPWSYEWRKSDDPPYLNDSFVVYDPQSDNKDILASVDLDGTREELGESAKANARAIAAVPDLIEALQTVLGIENFQALETVRYGGVPIAQIVKDALHKAGF